MHKNYLRSIPKESRQLAKVVVALRMRYRVREGRWKFATNAWFFQEGHAKIYERARYGEFRVTCSGDMLLVRMLGEKLERLGPLG